MRMKYECVLGGVAHIVVSFLVMAEQQTGGDGFPGSFVCDTSESFGVTGVVFSEGSFSNLSQTWEL